jgi:hypothetical protein
LLPPYLTKVILHVSLPDKPNPNLPQYRAMDVSMRALLYNQNTVLNYNILYQNKVTVETPAIPTRPTATAPAVPRRWIRWSWYTGLGSTVLPELLFKNFPLVAAGAVYVVVARQWLAAWLCGLVIGATLLVFPPLGGTETSRYYGHLVPCIVMLAAAGWWYLAQLVFRSHWRWAASALLAAILAVCLVKDIRNIQTDYSPQERTWLACAQYLKDHAPAGSIVLCRKNFPAFYGERRAEWLPDEQNLNDVLEYAGHIGAAYVIVDRNFTCRLMPQYAAWLTGPLPPCLQVAYEYGPGGATQARILTFTQ